MVKYVCKKCNKTFDRKYVFDRHNARKTSCVFGSKTNKKLTENKCEKCDCAFSRKDALLRHNKNCNGTKIITTNKSVSGKNNTAIQCDIKGNKNNVVINNNNYLFAFGKDGIDCLSSPEKITIFESDENPMEMIVVKTNLDPLKLNPHNVGVTDLHSGYGIIFDGNRWLTERIDIIMEVLLNSKEKDLLDIYEDIKESLSEDGHKSVKNALDDLDKGIRPRTKMDVKAKKNLIAHLKKHLYDKHHLALEAKKRTTNDDNITNVKEKRCKNILKPGLTIEELDRQIKFKKLMKVRIEKNKEIAKYLLNVLVDDNLITNKEFKLIDSRIDSITDIDTLQIIVMLLTKSSYFSDKISNESIDNKIKKFHEMNELVFGREKIDESLPEFPKN
jgi:hypothetical protein